MVRLRETSGFLNRLLRVLPRVRFARVISSGASREAVFGRLWKEGRGREERLTLAHRRPEQRARSRRQSFRKRPARSAHPRNLCFITSTAGRRVKPAVPLGGPHGNCPCHQRDSWHLPGTQSVLASECSMTVRWHPKSSTPTNLTDSTFSGEDAACVAGGILVPQPGVKPAVEAWSLNPCTARKSLTLPLKGYYGCPISVGRRGRRAGDPRPIPHPAPCCPPPNTHIHTTILEETFTRSPLHEKSNLNSLETFRALMNEPHCASASSPSFTL